MSKNRRQRLSPADQYDTYVGQIIRKHGVMIQSVGGSNRAKSPPFAYTVGLTWVDHPELLIFGHGPECSASTLNTLADDVLAGRVLRPTERVTVPCSPVPAILETVPNPEQIALTGVSYFRRRGARHLQLLQITLADQNNRYPWDANYAIEPWIQPRPGEFYA